MAVFSSQPGPRSGGTGDPQPGRGSTLPAGFASPAQDYYDAGIDLNRHLIRDATATFIMRVSGDAMDGAGISDGDELIVDRSLTPKDGSVVVAVLNGELIIRRLLLTGQGIFLHADSPGSTDIRVPDPAELSVWGVVTRCLHHV
ncbi:translesion error-prone DNA polymerase V autoproteolytic subunit [Arthrobacter sp. zg-ZUI100]|uniref:Translesion error-prone DNA polymerase V autoproteolytic subunit n=1 Tax=Arthrobacter jiangjiafuii TaxID=2817475 RepID=A0A975R0W4_9MICC|nr:translesion error-prone DNA polymerase V autoproteolytic subunit [Arthrobacter jiangjiafuii]MBP3035489.1 translesion error-prone DNA polymerase V autoproteolytic subunit [Arthrobacter jiangjiafuii]MBP3042311.1 translesion error-prone DNA polymerase V autoproteolytic subunit [Arthrobacter jiangjiafuii]QWC09933.1 translesion error-prone DNA polymerase V autoproteolytic subunit [Arthrobacter jiangjiafuii]